MMSRQPLPFVVISLLATIWLVVGCLSRQEEVQAASPRPAAPPSKEASVSGSLDQVAPAPYDPAPGVHAAEATSRPLVGMAWAFPSVVRLSPLTDEQRAMLGEHGDLAPSVSLPELEGLQPMVVRWSAADAQDHGVWQLKTSYGDAYLSPWLEVLSGPASEARATTADVALAAWIRTFPEATDTPGVVFDGQDAKAWGIESASSSAAMASVIWARLGRADEAAEWARRAGRDGFESLPAALAYRAHRMAIEGLPWGFDRSVPARLLAAAVDLSQAYAGRGRLVEDEATMRDMVRQDGVPPIWGEDEPSGTLQWARYQAWRLRDAGLPQGMEYTTGVGDPVVALLSGGEPVGAAMREMLDNQGFTRVPATDGVGPLPDLLRIGDLAYDVLSAEIGRHHLESRGVTRLFALDPEQREEVVAEIADEIGMDHPR
ncbi:MAG: hypothetical protein GX134_03380 [candidate division WS1 bacterium]|nr:hypothetical protein [candidate division WS1 bacterium]